MMEIDGGALGGSGTIVRCAVALASLTGRPIRITNARARRPVPGLRPQHVSAVKACAELCGAEIDGVSVGSRELTFVPGPTVRGGVFTWQIGTAGSAPMLALSIAAIACHADTPVSARIEGGVFQDFAPSPHHLQHVLLPLLARMGLSMRLDVLRAGYVPRGAGTIEVTITPSPQLTAIELLEQGRVLNVDGIAFASHLQERRVSDRMARACEARLAAADLPARIARVEDAAALHAGASLTVWARTSTGCVLGADRAGARGRTSETIGAAVAGSLIADLASGATVDRHTADQLVIMAALAAGTTRYRAPSPTEHLETNLWLVRQFGVAARLEGTDVTVEGLGVPQP